MARLEELNKMLAEVKQRLNQVSGMSPSPSPSPLPSLGEG